MVLNKLFSYCALSVNTWKKSAQYTQVALEHWRYQEIFQVEAQTKNESHRFFTRRRKKVIKDFAVFRRVTLNLGVFYESVEGNLQMNSIWRHHFQITGERQLPQVVPPSGRLCCCWWSNIQAISYFHTSLKQMIVSYYRILSSGKILAGDVVSHLLGIDSNQVVRVLHCDIQCYLVQFQFSVALI